MGPLANAALPGSFTVPLAVLLCSPGLLSSIMLRLQGVMCHPWLCFALRAHQANQTQDW